jgi:hypothetical protein
LIDLVHELEDLSIGHRVSLKELIPLYLDHRGLFVVLARPLQLLQGHLLGFISVSTSLCLMGPKVDHLRIQVVLMLKKELVLGPTTLYEGL